MTSLVHADISVRLLPSKLVENTSPLSDFAARWVGVLPTSSSVNTWSCCRLASCLPRQESGAAASHTAITWCDPEQATKALLESDRIATSVAPGQPEKTLRCTKGVFPDACTESPDAFTE